MGREVGGGIGMGKTCEPKAFSFQCMTKFTTNLKKKKKGQVPFQRLSGDRYYGIEIVGAKVAFFSEPRC